MSISLPIAGWLERHAGKQEVAGSIPGGGIHLLPIAQAMGIRIVLASSGFARNYFRRPCHAYWHDVSWWCMLVPRLCRYTTRTIRLDVYSHVCYIVAFGVDYSYVVEYIRTKTVSVGTNLSGYFYLTVQWSLLSKWLQMAAWMHAKIIMSFKKMNAGDGSSFFKKLLLV